LYPDNVDATVNYVTSGTIQMDLEEGFDVAEIEAIVKDSIADALGVHVNDIEVSIDPETNEITYKVKSQSFDDSAQLLEYLQTDEIHDAIKFNILQEIPTAGDV
jgi:hypothetical protein